MIARAFTGDDLLAFARLSGDRNPLHVDPAAARRTMAGEQTMHGVLGVLWALDVALSAGQTLSLTRVATTFRRPVLAGEVMHCPAVMATAGATTQLSVLAEERPRFDVTATWAPAHALGVLPDSAPPVDCRELTIDQLVGRSGETPLYFDRDALARLVPHVAAGLPASQLAFLLASTRVIGMECPGLHSLYVGFDLRFEGESYAPVVSWRAMAVNQKHGRVQVELRCGGMTGTLTAFVRPPPVVQASLAELAHLVRPGELAGARVFVVGGSRGLGEISAKIVAAAGGEVVVTFHQGEEDAQRVVAEIASAGGSARAIRLDVVQPDTLAALGDWTPTTLLYFASPRIDFGRAGAFSPPLFRRLAAYYVDGFAAVRTALHARSATPLRVLYASSEAITSTEPGAEYAAAKAAGEVVAAQLARAFGDTLHAPRFPRLRTDQTANVLSMPAAEPAPVVLDALRAVTSSR